MNRRELLTGGVAVAAAVTLPALPAIAEPTEYVVNYNIIREAVLANYKPVGFPSSIDYIMEFKCEALRHKKIAMNKGLPFHIHYDATYSIIDGKPLESIPFTGAAVADKVSIIYRDGTSKVIKDRSRII